MEKLHKHYPSIERFSNLDLNELRELNAPFTRLYMTGTVKLHGCNVGIGLTPEGEMFFQSRNKEITTEDDLNGFCKMIEEHKDFYMAELNAIKDYIGHTTEKTIILFGEYCGGKNQRGVGLAEVDYFFSLFEIYYKDKYSENETYLAFEDIVFNEGNRRINPEHRYFPINTFGIYNAVLDLDKPEEFVEMATNLAKEIGEHCPAAKYFGVDGSGEGVVFKYRIDNDQLRLKFKCEKFETRKSNKIPKEITEDHKRALELVDIVITPYRVGQAIEYMNEMKIPVDKEHISEFVGWLVKDVYKEDTKLIEESQIEDEKFFDKSLKKKCSFIFFKEVLGFK